MIQLSLIHHLMNHLISAVKPFPLPSPQLLTTRRHLSFHVVQKTLKVSGTQRETLLQRTLDTRGQLSKPPIFRWFCCVFFYSGQSSTWCFCDFQGDDMMIHLRLLLEFGKKKQNNVENNDWFPCPSHSATLCAAKISTTSISKAKTLTSIVVDGTCPNTASMTGSLTSGCLKSRSFQHKLFVWGG